MPANQITRSTTTITTMAPADLAATRSASRSKASQAAGAARRRATFASYQRGKAENTKNAQRSDLDAFAAYLAAAGDKTTNGEELESNPDAWIGIDADLIAPFFEWSLREGCAIATANRRLSTVRVYARLASDAGAILFDEWLKIKHLAKGTQGKEAKNLDKERRAAGAATRKGAKKESFNELDKAQRRALKEIALERDADGNPTPRGRRDALLIALALDHGLRIGEIVALTRKNFDLERGELGFYRPKVDKEQQHRLTPDTIRAFVAYVAAGHAGADDVPLLHRSRKNRTLTDRPLDERGAAERIALLGRQIGIANLSPHDLRHTWTTAHARRAANGECSLFDLQEAGGWSSLAMVRRYAAENKIANENLAISL